MDLCLRSISSPQISRNLFPACSSCYTQLHMVSLILWANFDGFQVPLVFVNHVPTWMVEIEARFSINDLNGSIKSINTHLLSLAKPTLI
ncbi:hypothetical protein HanRHA438_Chr04g0173481 [Helianthus annuus]|nr:hypothetical protein HanRHA438_Chr04g0173481 [Helianthus annuus]